jgi:NAD(P)-dependent dehydrogenase (short-subunit alcohol dehydrogenase family)
MAKINFNIAGKTALVTGGSRGIGLEIAKRLSAGGVKVAICGRKQDALEAARKEIGDDSLAVAAHIAKEEDVDRMFNTIIQKFGRLDILINNVGMNIFTPAIGEIENSLWQKIIDSNLNGTYYCSKKAAKLMKEQKSGKIVSITSTAGTKASPGMGVYGIAKAGIEMMTKVLAAELAPFNVQVNAVAPGMVRTDFSKPFWSNPEFLSVLVSRIPMGRIAEIEDIVNPVLFFASEGSSFVTGQTLFVDGGVTVV